MFAPLHRFANPVLTPAGGKTLSRILLGRSRHRRTRPHRTRRAAGGCRSLRKAVGKQAAWIYFSNNWFESRKFPAQMCGWVHGLAKFHMSRLMLRSGVDQRHPEKLSRCRKSPPANSMSIFVPGREAKYSGPVLVEWGSSQTGNWFQLEWKMERRRAKAAPLHRRLSAHCRSDAGRARR